MVKKKAKRLRIVLSMTLLEAQNVVALLDTGRIAWVGDIRVSHRGRRVLRRLKKLVRPHIRKPYLYADLLDW